MDWCTIFGAVVYGLDFALLVLMYSFDSHTLFPPLVSSFYYSYC